ncbi:hypothetical protein ACFWJE_11645 [Streptomyces griseoincarnatus]|nr:MULTISPECIES: hypothetical protein [unclassified Streptomyces]
MAGEAVRSVEDGAPAGLTRAEESDALRILRTMTRCRRDDDG